MRILVTGGAGYVGSACLRWLLAHGHDALAFDDLSEGNREAVPGERLVVGDILDQAALCAAMREHGSEAVMHFAALACVSDSIREPERYYRVNVQGTQSLLESMRACGVARIVLSSTAATYGMDGEIPLREDAPQLPATPYGKTKLCAEWMLEDYRVAHGLGYVILRYFNAAGADPDGVHGEDRRHETHLIPLILQAVTGRRAQVQIFGEDWPTSDGTCIRDYVHTEDLAQAHELAIRALHPGQGSRYNVGTGVGFSVRQILTACEAAVGHSIPYQVAPRRPGDPAVLVASSERLRNELGWKPRFVEPAEIVSSAWRWHESHPDGYSGKAQG